MAHANHDKDGGAPKLSTQKMFRILMDEIANNRREILDEMNGGFVRLEKRFDGLENRFDNLESEFRAFRIEVHQNHMTFLRNHDDHEKRITVLETQAA